MKTGEIEVFSREESDFHHPGGSKIGPRAIFKKIGRPADDAAAAGMGRVKQHDEKFGNKLQRAWQAPGATHCSSCLSGRYW